MCGIAGIIYELEPDESALSWSLLAEALESFAGRAPELSRYSETSASLAKIEELCSSSTEYLSLRTLVTDQPLQDRLFTVADRLSEWDNELQKQVISPEAGLEVHAIEDWNGLSVRARDVAWSVQQDALGSIKRLRALLPHPDDAPPKAYYEAWKLAATLENIGRLEVRGRDSLGISVMLSFAESAEYHDWMGWLRQSGHDSELDNRLHQTDLVDRSVVSDPDHLSFVFVYKVAQEVGALGDNVARISRTLAEDQVFWKAATIPSVATNIFSHTRWASNGVISEPNCHPVSELTLLEPAVETRVNGKHHVQAAPSPYRILACLNGDVDNYGALVSRLGSQTGRSIPFRISTDTKIIPVLIDYYCQQGMPMQDAFCRAMQECEGSIAVAMHSTLEPTKTYLALRGSGQALFVGLCKHGFVFASELYGVVEQTHCFVRMDGTRERVPGRPETAGQVLVLDAQGAGNIDAIKVLGFDGQPLEEPLKQQTAEITTRDINRGDYSHFLLKEISEAPISVRKTLRGKFFLSKAGETPTVRMNLGQTVIPPGLLERLRKREIRRIYLIGQGTAAVAGQAVAGIMGRILSGGPSVQAIKATELSGYALDKDLSDALVIAISQSGTTTDTNRTVDLVKGRGATIIGVVNRRNSDLVYKVDGVLYTSDGRDIEMSVASTKAFYSQVVAGYLLTYQLALAIDAMPEEQVYRELQELTRLPDLMRVVLGDQEPIKNLAHTWSPARRDWAIVGSGPTRAAADEIRIKLSELCYKSIATDFIEDKKHIDLSSEPLTLICAAGLPLMALKDAVKEVAIFKAHKSVPIVICTEGFNAFEPYAAGVLYVPKASEAASVLLNTLVGHLWGYYSASAIDEGAENLRQARALAVHYLDNEVDKPISTSLVRLGRDYGRRIVDQLMSGRLNSSLSVECSSKLLNLFRYFNSGASLRQFANDFNTRATPAGFAEVLINTLTQAISELSRPIDAIKHQAKTVTVGISRHEEMYEGPIFEALKQLEIAHEAVAYKDVAELRAMSPAILRVLGFTLYSIEGLGPLGEVTSQTTICVRSKHGEAASMRSRADRPHVLVGTKEVSVRRVLSYIGRGRKDKRPIVIIPLAPRGQVEMLALLHLEFDETLLLQQKIGLLRDLGGRYDDLRSQVLETDTPWGDAALERIATVDLVTLPMEQLTERVLSLLQGSAVGASRS